MADAEREEITPELLKTWSDQDIATALLFTALATGDVEAARVCKEAAERLKAYMERV
jgi:hypothetical protein